MYWNIIFKTNNHSTRYVVDNIECCKLNNIEQTRVLKIISLLENKKISDILDFISFNLRTSYY